MDLTQPVSDLVANRTIEISGIISPRRVAAWTQAIIRMVQTNKQQPIVINIDSVGGEAFSTLQFCSILQDITRLGTPIITRVTGMASSAACLIAIMGSRREATRHAKYYLHLAEGYFLVYDDICDDNTNALANIVREEALQAQEEIFDLITQRTVLDRHEVVQMCINNQRFGIDIALKKGFVDQMI